jgi:hypothetical protein
MVAGRATGTAATSRVGCESERRTYYSRCALCADCFWHLTLTRSWMVTARFSIRFYVGRV